MNADADLTRPKGGALVLASTAGLGAGLLFSVELLEARTLLPGLGGSPAVWTGSLVFFQALLVLGYALGSALLCLRIATQLGLFCLLIAAGALCLPPGVPAGWAPDPQHSLRELLLVLGLRVGLPFLALSTATPLLLAWGRRSLERPERLLAASNAGSLVGLLGYPFLAEPLLPLHAQALGWSAAYGLWALAIVGSGLLVVARERGTASAASAPGMPAERATNPATAPARGTARRERPAGFRAWLLLALVPSALIYALTSSLSVFIPPLPLLWVLPLAIYLLSFVLAFARPRQRTGSAAVLRLLVPIVLGVWLLRGALWRWPAVLLGACALQLVTFGLICWVLHSELARSAPSGGAAPDRTSSPSGAADQQLALFNLAIGLGGLAGGALGALFAPLVLSTPVELPLLLALSLPLLPESGTARLGRLELLSLAALAPLLAAGFHTGRLLPALPAVLVFGALALACVRQRRLRRARVVFVALLIPSLACAQLGPPDHAQTRSLHGTHRVADRAGLRSYLLSGVVHGRQRTDPKRQDEALAYYAPEAPLGEVVAAWTKRSPRGRVGVVGLGVGGLLAHARGKQRWRFFELDPHVEQIAREHFTYLRERMGIEVQVVLGDGRLSLRREAEATRAAAQPEATTRMAPPALYDLLVLDAFQGDAVPTHLLTEEAFALYLSRLKRDGLLVVNVSTRFLDLKPLLARHAQQFDLVGLHRGEHVSEALRREDGRANSHCVVLAFSRPPLRALTSEGGWRDLPPPAAQRWTDERASVLDLLTWVRLGGHGRSK